MTEENDNTQIEYKEDKQMGKAASLAMELSKEKKRLQEELSDMQAQFEEVSPSTHSGGPDSYHKCTYQNVVYFLLLSGDTYIPILLIDYE